MENLKNSERCFKEIVDFYVAKKKISEEVFVLKLKPLFDKHVVSLLYLG